MIKIPFQGPVSFPLELFRWTQELNRRSHELPHAMMGQALLMSPKGRNASRNGLVKLWEGFFVICNTITGTCGLSVTTFFHQVLNYYYLTVYIMFKPKMSLG